MVGIDDFGNRFAVRAFLVVLLAAIAPAQSPDPFSHLETAVPENVGPPLGFGDVNGDGSLDLIVAGVPYVLLNDGHGRFSPAVGSGGYLGNIPLAAIADFNQDGRADLLVLGAGPPLWYGTAAGTLVPSPALLPISPGAGVVSVAAGDVNGDGAPDIVLGRTMFGNGPGIVFVPAQTIVLLNDGTGSSFTNAGSLGLPDVGAAAMKFVDFDLDGDQDLAMSNAPNGIVIATNVGGAFTFPAGYAGLPTASAGLPPGTAPIIFVARLNADSIPDFVEWRNGTAPALFVGGPSGTTAALVTLPSAGPGITVPLAVLDLTGDGIDEVLISEAQSIGVYSTLTPGPAAVVARLDRLGGTLLAADLDGDADTDVLLLSRLIYYACFSDGAGGLHEQGPGLDPRFLLGGPIALDLSGDGAPELVGTQNDGGVVKLAIAQNDGAGRFTWTPSPIAGVALPAVASFLAAADVDGDGLKDLVLLEGTMQPFPQSSTTWLVAFRVISNGGGGLWTAGPSIPLGPAWRFDAAVADLNGDGFDDVVVGVYWNNSGLRIYFGSASGLVTTPALVGVGAVTVARIALFDSDADGDLDIGTAGTPGGLFINDGLGSFTQDPSFPPQYSSVFITTTDANGDGITDVYLNNTLFLHEGANWLPYGTIPPGPLNGANANPGEVHSFDFESDGDVDTVIGSSAAYIFETAGGVSTHVLPIPSGFNYYYGWRLEPVDLDRDGDLDLLGTIPVDQPQYFPTPRTQAVLYNTARHLTQDSPARPGRPLDMGLRGVPGGLWFVYASGAPTSIALPPFGTLFIDPLGAFLLASGSLAANGAATLSIPLPPSASSLIGTTFELQGFLDSAAGPRLTNARHVTVVSF